MKFLKQGLICLYFVVSALVVRAESQEHPDRVVQEGVPQGKVTSGQFNERPVMGGLPRRCIERQLAYR